MQEKTRHIIAFMVDGIVNYALCRADEIHVGDIVKASPGARPGVVVDAAYDDSGDCLRMISRAHAIHTDLILVERGEQNV